MPLKLTEVLGAQALASLKPQFTRWQDAAAGTPDPGGPPGSIPGPNDCNTYSGDPSDTGSRANCKSSWGVFDMIGNVYEWVADWADQTTTGCTDSTTGLSLPGRDVVCFGGDGSPPVPGALIRGGGWNNGTSAGVFAVGTESPSTSVYSDYGFRCAR